MADPLSIAGVAYPIARDLLSLAQQMKKIYKGIRHAKPNLKKMSDRTEIVAGTYKFFRETMKGVHRIKKLSMMFTRHGDLIKKVEDESQRLVDRLTSIKDKFRFLLRRKPVSLLDQCIAHFLWYNQSKEIVPALFQDMEVLENSMKTIGILVNTHILLQDYETNRSQQLSAQISSFQLMLQVEFQRLEQAQRGLLPTQNLGPRSFVQEVLQLLEREIPRIQIDRPILNSPSVVDSRSPSTSPQSEVYELNSPVAPPSTPPHPSDRDQSFEAEPEVRPEIERKVEEISMPRQNVRRRRSRSEPPQRVSPLSSSLSFLETVTEVENHDGDSTEQGVRGQNQDRGTEGAYMQMPPFGPPRFGPRPRPGRTSPDPSSPSGSRLGRQQDSLQRQGQPYPGSRRRNGSNISVYGNEGEVTSTHLTGFIELPPGGSRKARNRGNQ